MKKNKTKDQEQKGKPRRLSLSRETIRSLHGPVLELARGGSGTSSQDDPVICESLNQTGNHC